MLFEQSELALYQIDEQLTELHPHLPLVRLIGDVKSLPQIGHACATHRPQIVFHAAAYKHVPLMEEENAWMALQSNTLGTWHAATAAAQSGVERFVLISTDKATLPRRYPLTAVPLYRCTVVPAKRPCFWPRATKEKRGTER